MGGDGPGGATGPDPRLDDRVVELLSEHAGSIAFNGLRRTLGVHPESLTRALRRLERVGVVRRADGGYALREEGPDVLRPRPAPTARQVASVALPPGFVPDDLLGQMAGRWFGQLRWVGIQESPGDGRLVWSVANTRGHVSLAIHHAALRVYVDRPRNDPDAPALEDAAHDLLVHGVARLRMASAQGSRPVAYFHQPASAPFWVEN